MKQISGCRIIGRCLAFIMLFSSSAILRSQDSGLAPKPPMGWNSWYGNLCQVNDALIRAQADAMVGNGMKALGYEYVNIDDCWQGQRDAQGVIHGDKNFPDMKALADYIHSKGLKFGLYTSPGPRTCGQREGSYGHEELDAQTYAAWGVDFLKYDWCSAEEVYKPEEMQAAYRKMGDALKRTGRPILYSFCQYGLQRVWTWAPSAGGNMWRTAGDLGFNYDRVSLVGFQQDGLERFAGPGHWNDPDMLLVGLGKINDDENRTQMSLWCLLAAPVIQSADLTKVSPASLAIMTNPEVIAVDQDAAGIQGHRVSDEGPLDVWVKPLADGSKAVGLFNRGEGANPVTVNFKSAGIRETAAVRDLWAAKDLGTFKKSFTANVPPHGVVLVRIK
jgi:alpha-galactosidase